MLRNLLIISLLVTIAGASTLGWLIYEEYERDKFSESCRLRYGTGPSGYVVDYSKWLQLPESERGKNPWADSDPKKIRTEQHERLIAHVDRLAKLEPEMYSLADILYGDNWKWKLSKYQEQQEKNKSLFSTVVVLCGTGVSLVVILSVSCIIRYLIHRKDKISARQIELAAEQKQPEQQRVPITTALKTNSFNNQWMLEEENVDKGSGKENKAGEKCQNLYTDAESVQAEEYCGKAELPEAAEQNETDQREFEQNCINSYENLKDKAGNIDSQIKQTSKETIDQESNNPQVLDKTLSRLTEEISAIRQYAGEQQDRVKKLAEGYDWKIIRSFGLRVIRCTDNLERRITMLNEDEDAQKHLEEIRDELIFSLESSGLERYEPEINSDYRGQEKTAEAIKEKQPSESSGLKGKIANVVRCGYKYVIDEENFKVIRTAQVKLFE